MITLIGAFLGFFTSAVPEIFKFLNQKQDNQHELDVMDKQIEIAKANAAIQLEEINTQADIAESAALNERVKPIGIKWIDGLSASIRPIITYCFFIAYMTVKVAQYKTLGHMQPLPWQTDVTQASQWFNIILELWSDEDKGLFAAIISFWFGSRQMNRRAQG